ncbi:hypothetical protein NDN01_16290 [Sphingomonas sp. QA11]|uniref:hypothetical protein n=1 Tax=Sphingomonas sp. QA11 TaxID=2950605 RepID=UPI00234BEDC8|nr:hypothetical protein [Sphingomonas sp. QA11]WCM25597.1 hypothetical protein NDN01_16290 [Sphingomonas sp. QA11]
MKGDAKTSAVGPWFRAPHPSRCLASGDHIPKIAPIAPTAAVDGIVAPVPERRRDVSMKVKR